MIPASGSGEPLNPGEKRGAATIRERTGSRGYDPGENGEQRLQPGGERGAEATTRGRTGSRGYNPGENGEQRLQP
jgi:hypothetical protein